MGLTVWYLVCQINRGFALGDNTEDDELVHIRKRSGEGGNVRNRSEEH